MSIRQPSSRSISVQMIAPTRSQQAAGVVACLLVSLMNGLIAVESSL